MYFRVSTLVTSLTVFLVFSGCNYKQSKQADGGATSAQSLGTFNDLNANVFQAKCVRCHGSSAPSGGVDLSSYAAIISGSGLVAPGNPAASKIYIEVLSGDMPADGAPLSASEIGAIDEWITAGAPNGIFATSPVGTPVASASPTPIPVPGPSPSPTAVATPGPQPTAKFVDVQKQILVKSCVRCHSGSSPRGAVNLSSYALILGNTNKRLVVAGAPGLSLIYTEIANGSMPPSGSAVSAADQALLLEWIQQGAKNN